MITEQQLRKIMPNLGMQKLQLYLPHLNEAMQRYGVTNLARTAAFVAQLAHESAELRFMEELWGPIPAQLRYEPQSDLARRLGNTQPGDGKRFKGRGPIQITGRFNYQKYGDLLSIDMVGRPELAAQPEFAFCTAGLFWKTNGLNELADAGDFTAITRRINGGTNGLADREKYHARALQVLAEGFIATPPAGATRGSLRRGAPTLPSEPLLRGHEAIVGLPERAAAPTEREPEAAPRKRPRAQPLKERAARGNATGRPKAADGSATAKPRVARAGRKTFAPAKQVTKAAPAPVGKRAAKAGTAVRRSAHAANEIPAERRSPHAATAVPASLRGAHAATAVPASRRSAEKAPRSAGAAPTRTTPTKPLHDGAARPRVAARTVAAPAAKRARAKRTTAP